MEAANAEEGIDLAADPITTDEDIEIPSLTTGGDELPPPEEAEGTTEAETEDSVAVADAVDFQRWMNRVAEAAPGVGNQMVGRLLELQVETVGDLLRHDLVAPDALLTVPRLTESRVAAVWEHVSQDLGISTDALRKLVAETPESGASDGELEILRNTTYAELDIVRAKAEMETARVDLALEQTNTSLEHWKDIVAAQTGDLEKLWKKFEGLVEQRKRNFWVSTAFDIVLILLLTFSLLR